MRRKIAPYSGLQKNRITMMEHIYVLGDFSLVKTFKAFSIIFFYSSQEGLFCHDVIASTLRLRPAFKDAVLRPQPDTVSVSYEPQSCNSLQRQKASNHSAPVN